MMMKTRYLVAALLLTSLVALGLWQTQELSLYGETIYIPQYYTAECVERTDSMSTIDLGEVPREGEFYSCTTAGTGKWTPIVNGVQCRYQIDKQGASYAAYICPVDFDTDASITEIKESCEQERRVLSVDTFEITVNAGEHLFVDPAEFFGLGGVHITGELPSYGLRVRQSDGFVSPTTTSCLVEDIREAGRADEDAITPAYALNLQDRVEIVPGVPANAVSGLQPAKSTQAVVLEGVNNGEPVYISRPGYYYDIKETPQGFEYVDTKVEYRSSLIQCIPRTTGCSDEAKTVDLVDQSCDEYGGMLQGYNPVQGDNSRLCEYSCIDGELEVTNQCIEVEQDCPDDAPLWDASTGQCVTLAPQEPGLDNSNLLFIVTVGLIAVSIILSMMIVRQAMDRRKK